jgi:hypothetical protein
VRAIDFPHPARTEQRLDTERPHLTARRKPLDGLWQWKSERVADDPASSCALSSDSTAVRSAAS